MGTGKSSVGRALAKKMSRPYVDLDDQIVERANTSIKQIFSHDGEGSFRTMEQRALRECGDRMDGPVVALGGGSLLEKRQRDWTRKRGPVICLWGKTETLVRRIGDMNTARPLLRSDDVRASIATLMKERKSAYKDSDLSIETDNKSVTDVVTTVLEQLKTKGVK